jgi:opacity protein-like surface antigen
VLKALRHTLSRMRRSFRTIGAVLAIASLAVCCASSAQASDHPVRSASPRAHISTELTEAKAVKVMNWNIRRVCKTVEYKVSAIEIKPGFPHAKVHLKVKNGKCTQSSVVRSTCKGSRWTSQSDVDMSMLGQPYFRRCGKRTSTPTEGFAGTKSASLRTPTPSSRRRATWKSATTAVGRSDGGPVARPVAPTSTAA